MCHTTYQYKSFLSLALNSDTVPNTRAPSNVTLASYPSRYGTRNDRNHRLIERSNSQVTYFEQKQNKKSLPLLCKPAVVVHNTPAVRRRQLLIVRRRESRGVARSRSKVFPLRLVQGRGGAIPAPAQRKRSQRRGVGGSPQVADGETLAPAVRELSSGIAFFVWH